MQTIIQKAKGQVSLVAVAITAGATILASVFGGWATANERVNLLDTKIQVVEKGESDHYNEIKELIAGENKKIDRLIELHMTTNAR